MDHILQHPNSIYLKCMCPPAQSHPLIKSRLPFKKGLYNATESHLLHLINLLPRIWK